MTKRLGILTGGGDCPGLNAAIRAVVKHATSHDGWEVVGIMDSFEGLVSGETTELPPARVRGLLDRGGTILGSSNRSNPFAFPLVGDDGQEKVTDVSARCMETVERLGLTGVIVIGGDGTMGIANRMQSLGLRVVGIPKTIDNDLQATDVTIGFQTAVDVATAAIDRLHTTAESHDRVIVCEVMGRYAGWLALHAGLAAGAEIILIPEIDYDIRRVVDCIRGRHERGISFSIAVIAEGARPIGGSHAVTVEGDATIEDRLGGAANRLAAEINDLTHYDTRVTVLGHIQRGGTPSAADRLLATRLGVKAVDLAIEGQFGQLAVVHSGEVTSCAIADAVARPKRVDPDCEAVAAARAIGIELGR